MKHSSFVISTQLPLEQRQLEESHPSSQGKYRVRLGETQGIMGMLDAIYHQYYLNSASVLSSKVLQLAKQALNLTLSLTLFRDILTLLQHYEQRLDFVSEYLTSLEELVEQRTPNTSSPLHIHKKQEKSPFQKIAQISTHETLRLSSGSSQRSEAAPDSVRPHEEMVRQTLDLDLPFDHYLINPQAAQYFRTKGQVEDGVGQSRQGTSLHCSVYTESSKAITQYDLQGENVLQQSMARLLREDFRESRKREGQVGARRVAERSAMTRFSKQMRTRLMQAKLRKRCG